MFKYGPKNSTKIRVGDSAAVMADKLDAQARELHMKASMLRLRGDDALGPRLHRERILTREELARMGGPSVSQDASGTGDGFYIERRYEFPPGDRNPSLLRPIRPPGRIPSRDRQMHLQDPEPKTPAPHPDDGLPDPGNGRPCPPDTRGGCPPADPRPIPDPTPHPGGPVLV